MKTANILGLLAKSSVAALAIFTIGIFVADKYLSNESQKPDKAIVSDSVVVNSGVRHSVKNPEVASNAEDEASAIAEDDSFENIPVSNHESETVDSDQVEIIKVVKPKPNIRQVKKPVSRPRRSKKSPPGKKRAQKKSTPREAPSQEKFIELLLPTVTLNEQRGVMPDIPPVPSVATEPTVEETVDPDAYDDDDIDMDVVSVSSTGLGEDIILDVYLRNSLIYQGLFCVSRDGVIYYPLSELFGVLGFPIEISPEGAEGWYIKEKRKFSLSLKTGRILNNGRVTVIPKDSFFYSDDELYLAHEQFSDQFPLRMNLDLNALILNILPLEYLPMELIKIRQGKRYVDKVKNSLKFPLQDLDYAAIAPPRLDAQLNIGYLEEKSGKEMSSSVAGHYRGDLMYMSTSLFGTASYNTNDKSSDLDFNNFSLSAERLIQDNPYVSKVTVGDIIPSSTPLGSSGSLERGVRLTNKRISASSEYDTKTITGKTMPGWDVELYHNDRLVGFQTVDDDGTYLFENVELYFGSNRFKLILYGTEGQEETREELVTIGSSMLAGEVLYDISASQQGVGVFDKKYSEVKSVGSDADGTGRFKAAVNVGLGNGYALRTGITKDIYDNKDRVVSSVGLSGGYDGLLGQVDVGYSTSGSTQIKSSIRTKLDSGKSVNLSGSYQLTDNYKESNIKSAVSAGYSDNAQINDSTILSYGNTVGRTHTSNEDHKDSIYYDLSGNVGLFSDYGHFTTNLGLRLYEKDSSGQDPSVYGSSTYYKSYSKGTVRGNIEYGVDDAEGAHVRTLSASGTYRMTDKASTSLGVSKYLTGQERLSVTNSWSYSMDKFTPYLQGVWNDDSTYSVYMGLSLSMDFDPNTYLPKITGGGAGNGGASCLVFNDRNYNGHFDEGDIPIKDAILKSHQSYQEVLTDENGRALFRSMSPQHSTDISIDPRSIKDLRLTTDGGTAITPRAGKIYDLEFPLHVTGTVEGYAYIISDDQAKGKPMVPVQLVDNKGEVVATSWTEQDGFFVIEHVLPGEYSARIDEEFLTPKEYASIPSSSFTITKEGEDVRGTYLFYGKEKNVAILGDKFKSKMQFGDDVVSYTDYSNLDEPAEDDFWDPVRMASSILGNAANKNTETADSDSKSMVADASKDELNNIAKPKEDQSNIFKKHALILNTFVSEKSAIRAVSHYRKNFSAKLPEYSFSYKRFKEAYVVVVKGIKNQEQLYKITNLFMCEPRLIAVK